MTGSGKSPGAPRRRSPVAVLVLTVLGAIVPGVGLIAAGRFRSGLVVLVATVSLAVGLVLYVGTSTSDLLNRALDPATLRWGAAAAVVLAVAWSAVTIASHRALRPATAAPGERVGGFLLVGVLCLAVATPLVIGANVLLTSRQLLQTVVSDHPVTALSGGDLVGAPTDSPSPTPGATATATSTTRAVTGYTWEHRRLNILLIGSDAGPDRTGTRTDSMVIASIDTITGKVLIVSIPRNLCRLTWDPASTLGGLYPNGWTVSGGDCKSSGNGDDLINAIYNDIPIEQPGAVGRTGYPGADALALGLGYSLKLPIDYFLAVDLAAFRVIVNSIGGVTVNINTPVPVGGMHDAATGLTITQYPSRWLMPGPNQHLDGQNALWYARGRFYSDDYDRINRQKCMITALTHQANPATVLANYSSLAGALENNILTDIPRKLLSPLAQLALKIKSSGATSSITVDTANIPGMAQDSDPHWAAAAQAISQAIAKTDRVKSTAAATSPVQSPSQSPSASLAQSLGVSPTPSATTPRATTASGATVTTDVAAGCTYQPTTAAAAIKTWQATIYGSMYTVNGDKR